jgi:hypothetical protein
MRSRDHPILRLSQVAALLLPLLAGGSGWVLDTAYAINEAGQIVGSCLRRGRRRAFLLTPPAGGL